MQCPHCQQQLPASAITPSNCPYCGQPLGLISQPIDLPDLNDILPPEADTKRRLPTSMLQPEAAIELPPLDIAPLNPAMTAPTGSAADNAPGMIFPDMPAPAMPSFAPIAPPPPAPAMPSFAPIAPPPPAPAMPMASNDSIALPDLGDFSATGAKPTAPSSSDMPDMPGLLSDTDLDIPFLPPIPPPEAVAETPLIPPAPLPETAPAAPMSAPAIPQPLDTPVMLPDLGAIAGLTQEEKDNLGDPTAIALPDTITPDFPLPDISAAVGLNNQTAASIPLPDLAAVAPADNQAGSSIPLPDLPAVNSNPSFIADLPLPSAPPVPEEQIPAMDFNPLMDMPAPAPMPAGGAIAMDMAPLPEPVSAPIDTPPVDLANLPDVPDLAPLEDVPSVVSKIDLPDITNEPLDLLGAPADLLPAEAPSLLDNMSSIGSDTNLLPDIAPAEKPLDLDFAIEPTGHIDNGPETATATLDDQGNVSLESSSDSIQLETVAKVQKQASVPTTAPAAVPAAVQNQADECPANNEIPEEENGQAAKTNKKSNKGLAFAAVLCLLAGGGVAMEYVTPYGYFGHKLFSASLTDELPPPELPTATAMAVADSSSEQAALKQQDQTQEEAVPTLPERGKIPHIAIEKLPALIEELSTSSEDKELVKPVLADALFRGYVILGTSSYKNALLEIIKNDKNPVSAATAAALAPKASSQATLKKLAKVPGQKAKYNELTYYWHIQKKEWSKALPLLKNMCRNGSCRDAAISYLRQAPAGGNNGYLSVYQSLPAVIKVDPLFKVMVAHRLEKDKNNTQATQLLEGISLPQTELLPTDRSWLITRDVNSQIINGHLKEAQDTIKELLAAQPNSKQLSISLGDISIWLKEYSKAATIFNDLASSEENSDPVFQAKAWFATIMSGDLATAGKELDAVSTADKKSPHYKLAEAWLNSLTTPPTKEEKAELTKLFNKTPELTALAMHYKPLVALMEDSVLLAANKPWSSQIQTQVRQLEYFNKRHMPVKAKEKFSQISPANHYLVNPVDLRCAIADFLIMTGHASEALKQIEPLMKDLPEDITLLATMGTAQKILGQHAEAAATYKKAAELSNKDLKMMLLAANEYLSAGDNNSALSLLNILTDHNGTNEEILYLLARSWLDSDFNKARRYISEAIQLNAKEARYYTILGICESKNGRTNDAIKNFKQSLQLDSKDRVALRHLAEISMDEEAYSAAIGYLQTLAKLVTNDASIYTMMAKAHSELDQRDKAIAAYQLAAKLAPNDAAILVELAKLYQEADRGQDAQKLYERAIKIDPKNQTAFLQLGYYYKEQAKDAKAVEMFRKFLSINPDAEQAHEIELEINDLSH